MLERRIHVYKVGFFEDQNGTMRAVQPGPAFAHVRGLNPQANQPSRYLPLPDGNQLMMEIVANAHGAPQGSIRGRFGAKRMVGLPQVEDQGVYSDLQLAATAGLAELRHFVVYPGRGLMGLELNGNAPGPGRWAGYLMDKCPTLDLVTTDMILAGTTEEMLNRAGRLAGTTLTVYPDHADDLGRLDDHLKRGVRAIKATSANAREITIGIELGSQKRDESLELDFKDRIRAFLRSPTGRETVSDFQIRAFDNEVGRTRWLDLLEDRYVGYKTVATLDAAGRVVDSDSMFSAIDEVVASLP